jgi:hypothetical protein
MVDCMHPDADGVRAPQRPKRGGKAKVICDVGLGRGCDAKLERKLTFQMKAGSALLKASRLQAQCCCACGGVGGGRERFPQTVRFRGKWRVDVYLFLSGVNAFCSAF